LGPEAGTFPPPHRMEFEQQRNEDTKMGIKH